MPIRTKRIRRRDFLRTGSAGLAGLIAAPACGQLLPAGKATRRAPQNPVILRSPRLEIILDREDGLPYEYLLSPGGLHMRGEDSGRQIGATFCCRKPWGVAKTFVRASLVSTSRARADFQYHVAYKGHPAASFVIRYRIQGPVLWISMESIEEATGYELLDVDMPQLVTVREEDGPAWFAHGDEGGSLVNLSDAQTGHLPLNRFWGRVLATLPVVMLGTNRSMCVLEVSSYMDGTELAVTGNPGSRHASAGTVKVHRVNGSLCYDMNTGKGTPLNCGGAGTPNLLVEQKSVCRLDFIASEGGGAHDWFLGAKLVRERMPPIRTHIYDNKLVYAIHCDEPHWKKPGATFEQAAEIIRRIDALTDGWPQIAHLWGWQYRGKDTGYPAVAEVNARLGGYNGLMNLMEEAQKLSCVATLSDNYDDAYKSSPAWDPAIIARGPDGQLWESRNWTGENSYIIGLAKYMKGAGVSRTDYTCTRYRLHDTIHTDVLTYFPIRNDWDRERPASGIKNLTEGRYKVLSEFAKFGVDVSSEAMRFAFAGKVSYYWYAQGPGRCPFGGKPIPLLPMIYRHTAAWGQSGKTPRFEDKMLKMLFYNGCPRLWVTADTDPKEITDWIYLMMIPWFKIHQRPLEGFTQAGEASTLHFDGNSRAELNWHGKTYTVWDSGVEIARDGCTFCPLDENRIAFYSLAGQDLSARLPQGWNPHEIAALVLSTGEPREGHLTIKNNTIAVSMPSRQPVIVYRDGEAAKKRLLRGDAHLVPAERA